MRNVFFATDMISLCLSWIFDLAGWKIKFLIPFKKYLTKAKKKEIQFFNLFWLYSRFLLPANAPYCYFFSASWMFEIYGFYSTHQKKEGKKQPKWNANLFNLVKKKVFILLSWGLDVGYEEVLEKLYVDLRHSSSDGVGDNVAHGMAIKIFFVCVYMGR